MARIIIIALAIISISSVQGSIFEDPLGFASNVIGIGQFTYEIMEGLFKEPDHTLEDISKNIELMNSKLDGHMKNVVSKIEDLPSIIDLVDDRKKLKEHSGEIGEIFKELSLMKKRMDLGHFNNKSSHKESWNLDEHDLKIHIRNIRRIMFNSNITSYLTADFQNKLEKYENVCNTQMSHLQLLRSLFSSLKLSTAQYYISRHMIYKFWEFETGQDMSLDKINLDEDVLRDYRTDIFTFKGIMSSASREFWRCDPTDLKDHERYAEDEESSFSELQIFSYYLTMNDDFDDRYLDCPDLRCNNDPKDSPSYKTCIAQNCPTYTQIKKCKDEYYGFCIEARLCPNKLHDCEPLPDAWDPMKIRRVCMNENSTATARYTTILPYEKADDFRCPEGLPRYLENYVVAPDVSPIDHEYYQCMCNENVYYVAHSTQIASEAHVVVGAKLTLHQKTLYVQIQEGKLLPGGLIDSDSIKWRPIDHDTENYERFEISYTDARSFELTEVELPRIRVITGLGFIKKPNNRFALSVHSAGFNFRTGKVLKYPLTHRTELIDEGSVLYNLTDTDVPTKSDKPNTPHSKKNQYVKFDITSLEKDGGQTTIPFIDTQKVESNSPAPLAGASLYIRGQKDYGGFLGIKLKTYDFVPHIKVDQKLCLDLNNPDPLSMFKC